MNHSDRAQFKEIFNGLSEMYQSKDVLSKIALQLYFGALEQYPIDTITSAVSAHIADPTHGTFYPKVADIIRHIEGAEITVDQVLGMARLKSCPLGVLCAIKIGSWDLENQTDATYMRQRAHECLLMVPEWKSRGLQGEYTSHEVSVMLKYDVNPSQPFIYGIHRSQEVSMLTSEIENDG